MQMATRKKNERGKEREAARMERIKTGTEVETVSSYFATDEYARGGRFRRLTGSWKDKWSNDDRMQRE